MMTPSYTATTPAHIAAVTAARNRFGADADLTSPSVAAFLEDYSVQWEEGARRVREGMREVFSEPNAWMNRAMVLTLFEAGSEPAAIIAALRSM